MKTETLTKNRIETVNTNGNGHSTEVKQSSREVTIKAPNFQNAIFTIKGTAPLVIKRFSEKQPLIDSYVAGGKKKDAKKVHAPKDLDEVFNKSRYISPEGWDGFNASSIRCATIRACSLVDYKMVLAKMSIFVKEDGWDAIEPQIPLVRIYGKAIRQDDAAVNPNTGTRCVTTRAAYRDWRAEVNIRWDGDQFSLQDVTNLIMRAGVQVGIGEGRPFSKNSAGMGWGTFEIVKK